MLTVVCLDRVEFALSNLCGKMLDVGYSIGGIHAKFIEKFGLKNIYGVDIETKKGTSHYKQASAEKIPFRDKEFDSVFAGELIEHLESPNKFLEEVNRLLKDKGTLIITTPNRASLVNRVFHSYETHVHISLMDYNTLKKMLEDKGFWIADYFCQPYSEENAYGSRNKWTFALRAILHNLLPKSLQEQMIVKATKIRPCKKTK